MSEFDDFFKSEKMSEIRALVHDLYPDVQEKIAWKMPGFYPKNATKSTQQLFMLQENQNHLGIYGIGELEETDFAPFLKFGVKVGKGSLQIPNDSEMSAEIFKKLLQFIMRYNFQRHGVQLMHDSEDFAGRHK